MASAAMSTPSLIAFLASKPVLIILLILDYLSYIENIARRPRFVSLVSQTSSRASQWSAYQYFQSINLFNNSDCLRFLIISDVNDFVLFLLAVFARHFYF